MNLVSAPEVDAPAHRTAAYQYLLLGELRLLLEEAADADDSQRWLLAVLDRLLASYPREDAPPPHFSAVSLSSPLSSNVNGLKRWKQKLQRLRDRVAHRAPFQILANEIRCDLRALVDQHHAWDGA